MEDALSLLPDHLREGVESGALFIADPKTWYSPDKPVVRSSENGQIVKGSGKVAGSKDAAVASKETAYKRTKGYRAAMEKAIVAFKDDPQRGEAVTSLEEIIEAAWKAAKGQGNVKEMLHLVELVHGKARETSEINVNSQHIHAILNERTPVDSVAVRVLDPKLIEERRRVILEAE